MSKRSYHEFNLQSTVWKQETDSCTKKQCFDTQVIPITQCMEKMEQMDKKMDMIIHKLMDLEHRINTVSHFTDLQIKECLYRTKTYQPKTNESSWTSYIN